MNSAKIIAKSSVLIAAVFLFNGISATMAGQPITNEQFVIDAITNSASSLLDSLQLGRGEFSIMATPGIDELAVDGMRLALLKAGWVNSSNIEDSPGTACKIDVTFSAFNFDYKRGKSRGFLKKPFVKRELAGQLLVKIIKPGYSYIGFRDVGSSDAFTPAQANYVASLRYNQLSPSVPGAGVTKYLEPLAVTAAAGGLIYLFFANR